MLGEKWFVRDREEFGFGGDVHEGCIVAAAKLDGLLGIDRSQPTMKCTAICGPMLNGRIG